MPYLQVDLDGKRKWPLVAAGLGISEAQVCKGFLDLWESCWREKSSLVGLLYLECLFAMPGQGERVTEVLCGFGFLEEVSGGFRIAGAEKYLRVQEARSLGGKRAAGNLKRGKSPGSSRKPAGSQPESTSGSGPALTPNTQHPAPNIETIPPKTAGDELAGWKELVAALFESFRGDRQKDPEPSGRDWKALKRLRERTKQGDREIVVRWQRGLRAQFKQRVDCFADLDERWDSLASGDPPRRAGGARFVNAQDVDKTSFSKVGTFDDF